MGVSFLEELDLLDLLVFLEFLVFLDGFKNCKFTKMVAFSIFAGAFF